MSLAGSGTWDIEGKVEKEMMLVDNLLLEEQPFEIVECRFGKQMVKVFLLTGEVTEVDLEQKKQVGYAPGFVIDKCLRKVKTEHESRDIYSAYRCEFDQSLNCVATYFPEERFVIKRVSKNRSGQVTNFLRREFKVQSALSQINHPAFNKIATYHESASSIFAVSFSAGNCDLLDFLQDHIEKHNRSFDEEVVAALFKPVIEAFAIAYKMGIAHRDISLENLVVSDSNNMQIIDWGHAVSTRTGVIEYKGAIGKERYFAPELVFRSYDDGKFYDPFKADVFSLGVCLFSALTAQMPFSTLEDHRANHLRVSADNLINNICNTNINLSNVAIDVLDACLAWDFQKRSSMEELLQHQFFRKV